MPDSQERFSQALLDSSIPVPDGMLRPDGMPAARRFDIYRNNVVKSLVDALEEGFPVTRSIVGESFFRAMAGAFVRAHPPRSPCIIFYGDGFPTFIDGFDPVSRLPYLGDVARLEHSRRMSYFAADDCCADPLVLRDIDAASLEETRFALRASCRIVRSEHPIWSIWRYNSTDDRSAIGSCAEDVLVSRPGDTVLLRPLPPGAAVFLFCLRGGTPLGRAAQSAGRMEPEFNLAASLGVILEAHVIRTIIT